MLKTFFALSSFLAASSASAMDFQLGSYESRDVFPLSSFCENGGVRPSFVLKDVPRAAQTLAIVVSMASSNSKESVRWLVYDIPASAKSFSGHSTDEQFQEGVHSKSERGYDAPCLKEKPKAIKIKLYALNSAPKFFAPPTIADFMATAQTSIVSKVEKSFKIPSRPR